MSKFRSNLTRFHSDTVVDAAEANSSNSFHFDEMILRMFARKICEATGFEYTDEIKKVVQLTSENINEFNQLNYMHGFVYGAEHAVINNLKHEDIEVNPDNNCEFTMNRDFAFIFNFGDNDFGGYIIEIAKMYCEKYNREMRMIEDYVRFNVPTISDNVDRVEKYESWRTIKEMFKSLYNYAKTYWKCDRLDYANTNLDMSKLIEEINNDIKYLEFDNPNQYVFGTNEQITKILDDGYKYDDKPIEETYYWNNGETLVIRVKNGRMTYKVI